jgi:spore cortex biosynthesis protein YabQ
MDPLSYQLFSVLTSLSIGVVIGLFFDLYRISRGFIRPQWWLTQVGDIVFWLIATMIAFFILFKGNWGEVRPYVFISVAIGFYIYTKVISKRFQKVTLQIIRFIQKTINLLIRMVLFPIRLLQRIILVPIGLITYSFHQAKKIIKGIFRKVFTPIFNILTKLRNSVRRTILRFKNNLKQKTRRLLKKLNPFKGKKKE